MDALTRRPGDLPEGGDERLNNMKQLVLKPQNLLEQLSLLVDSPPVEGCYIISNIFTEPGVIDPLPAKILETI